MSKMEKLDPETLAELKMNAREVIKAEIAEDGDLSYLYAPYKELNTDDIADDIVAKIFTAYNKDKEKADSGQSGPAGYFRPGRSSTVFFLYQKPQHDQELGREVRLHDALHFPMEGDAARNQRVGENEQQ